MVLEKERQRQGDMRMGGKPSTKCPITQIFLFLPVSLWVVGDAVSKNHQKSTL